MAGAASPARQATLRERNLRLALQQIAHADLPISRADIAGATGMTRATASALVDLLIGAGLVRETGANARTRGGRPGTGLELSPDGPAGLGLEVNVDYTAACVVDLAGHVRHLEVLEGDQRGASPEDVVAALGRAATAAAKRTGLRLHAATVALPGLVRAPTGPLQLAPNLGWRDLDILALLRERPELAGLELAVDNEANLAALAEMSATGHRNAMLVSGEIGIGAGIVIDGALYRGRHGWSGELGHLAFDPAGRPCTCGASGCVEQYAGQEALLAASGAASKAELLQRAQLGDPQVTEVLAGAGSALGVAVSGALNLLDLERVVLAGTYRDLAPWLAPAVQREVEVRVVAARWAAPTVVAAAVGPEAAVVGAARSVLDAVRADPARWVAGQQLS